MVFYFLLKISKIFYFGNGGRKKQIVKIGLCIKTIEYFLQCNKLLKKVVNFRRFVVQVRHDRWRHWREVENPSRRWLRIFAGKMDRGFGRAQPSRQWRHTSRRTRKAAGNEEVRRTVAPTPGQNFFFTSRTHWLCITRHSRVAGGLCWVKTINNQHSSNFQCRGLN